MEGLTYLPNVSFCANSYYSRVSFGTYNLFVVFQLFFYNPTQNLVVIMCILTHALQQAITSTGVLTELIDKSKDRVGSVDKVPF